MAIREARPAPQLASIPELVEQFARDPGDSSCDRQLRSSGHLGLPRSTSRLRFPEAKIRLDRGDLSCGRWTRALPIVGPPG